MRVLCVDDHAVLIEGLKAHFGIQGRLVVVGQLATAERLIEEIDRLKPHVVLLDIEMPGPDAFETADRVRRSYPSVRVIVLSAHIRDGFISAAFASGICGYFAKSDSLEEIVAGIEQVVRNVTPTFLLGPKIRARCRANLAGGPHARHGADADHSLSVTSADGAITLLSSLTARELEILRLIGKGLPRAKIAAQICRSVKTVDGHQDRMMRKLGISARADLMRFAIREGLAQA